MAEWYDRANPAPELLKLEPFVGDWESTDFHEAMPWMTEGGSGVTKNTFKKALDGYCYITEIEAQTPFGSIKGHGFLFFDREIQKYRIEWYDNFGNHLSGMGDFDDLNKTLTLVEKYRMNGVDVVEKHISKLVDEASYIHVVETMMDEEFKLTSTLNYKKVKMG